MPTPQPPTNYQWSGNNLSYELIRSIIEGTLKVQ